MKRKLYLDASVIGGYFDGEFKAETRKLWKLMEQGHYEFHTSAVTVDELLNAPESVTRLFAKAFPAPQSILRDSPEIRELAAEYIANNVVGEKSFDDARHVATCTLSGIVLLVSWNFKHLANFNKESGFNHINRLNGYAEVRILSPRELVYGHEENI